MSFVQPANKIVIMFNNVLVKRIQFADPYSSEMYNVNNISSDFVTQNAEKSSKIFECIIKTGKL